MSKVAKEERTELLVLCRDFVKAELEQIASDTEVNKSLTEVAWEKIVNLVRDKREARLLAASEVAKQYIGG